jgi:hypothetical protein
MVARVEAAAAVARRSLLLHNRLVVLARQAKAVPAAQETPELVRLPRTSVAAAVAEAHHLPDQMPAAAARQQTLALAETVQRLRFPERQPRTAAAAVAAESATAGAQLVAAAAAGAVLTNLTPQPRKLARQILAAAVAAQEAISWFLPMALPVVVES